MNHHFTPLQHSHAHLPTALLINCIFKALLGIFFLRHFRCTLIQIQVFSSASTGMLTVFAFEQVAFLCAIFLHFWIYCSVRFWILIFNLLQNKTRMRGLPLTCWCYAQRKGTHVWVYLKHVNRNCCCDGSSIRHRCAARNCVALPILLGRMSSVSSITLLNFVKSAEGESSPESVNPFLRRHLNIKSWLQLLSAIGWPPSISGIDHHIVV